MGKRKASESDVDADKSMAVKSGPVTRRMSRSASSLSAPAVLKAAVAAATFETKKRATKKRKGNDDDGKSDHSDDEESPAVLQTAAAAVFGGTKKAAKKKKAKDGDGDSDYIDDEESPPPTRKRRRSTKAEASVQNVGINAIREVCSTIRKEIAELATAAKTPQRENDITLALMEKMTRSLASLKANRELAATIQKLEAQLSEAEQVKSERKMAGKKLQRAEAVHEKTKQLLDEKLNFYAELTDMSITTRSKTDEHVVYDCEFRPRWALDIQFAFTLEAQTEHAGASEGSSLFTYAPESTARSAAPKGFGKEIKFPSSQLSSFFVSLVEAMQC
ncbi:hypothetical protein AURDEDRAFT_177227 [Auricularia subglabra TFB-10046 SS5]|uniref:Uncharacterized protein n=1 Tax=Auricularia subglabra (strain TFB-10046 / SS5) TaxID=717982 RepID=J0LB71_AURST|nr:hypothetical protein AURDEDRAFT_177227 [Auricularia subglabra TFB-10046 SS5]